MERRRVGQRRPAKKSETTIDDDPRTPPPLLRPSEPELTTPTDQPSEEDKWEISDQSEEEETGIKSFNRIIVQSSRERRRIVDVARRVVQEPDGHLTEKLLLRLLGITRNRARWGFLSPDHPAHPYYLKRKDVLRSELMRIVDLSSS